MRTALTTVVLVVALQGIASASPMDENSTAPAPVEAPSAMAPVNSNASKAEPQPRADTERKPAPNQPQVLSKNFQSPKPVQVYWFFGGR